jgi:SPP1 gp7 family putative phage head morphogenesis protein
VANRFTRAAKALFARVTPLEQDIDRTPPKDDVASYEKSFMTLGPRYNPDKLVGRQGLQIYDKMRLDEQVKAVMNFKRDAITARGWTFKYEEYSELSETEQAKRIRVFTEIMGRMHGSFLDALNLISTGRDYGFSMTEKVYSDVTIDGETYVGINMLLARAPDTFEFYVNDYGILERVEQLVPGRRTRINMSRMIHYVHSPEFDRFYGRSDLREAYRAWFIKQRIQEFWLQYLERMAGGFFVLKPKEDGSTVVPGSATEQSIEEMLKNLHSTAGIKLPSGYEETVYYPTSTDAYEKAVVHHDLAIAKSLLVPNLLGISHAGQTGAFAQSQTQLEAFFWTLNADSERLAAVVNEQLVKDLGDQNFGDGEYPYFCFKPASREHIKQVIADWKTLVDAGAVVATEEDEEHFRKLLEMPKPGGEPLMDPMEDGQAFNQDITKKQEARAERQARLDEKAANDERYAAIRGELGELKQMISGLRPAGDGATPKAKGATPSDARPQAGSNGAKPHGKLKTATVEQFSLATHRVAFAVIENRQDRMATDLTRQVSALTAKVTKRLLGSDEQLAELIDNDPTDVASVEFSGNDKAKLKDIFRRNLSGAWTLGGELARNELERARGQRLVRMRDLRDTAAEYFEVNGFRMAGNVSDGVRALIQQELQNSIKFGRTAQLTREVIWDRLVSRGFVTREAVREVETDPAVIRALNDLWGASETQTAAYLDTLARTNLFEAMNEARYAEFTDPALGDFVVALEYSAILDDRTTEICEALNGKVYAADSPEWDNIRPPNHFNCRSVLIPVTQIDGWDGRESPAPSVEPHKGFGATLQ